MNARWKPKPMAYHVRRFSVDRELILKDIWLGETDLENKVSKIAFSEAELAGVLDEFGVTLGSLEIPAMGVAHYRAGQHIRAREALLEAVSDPAFRIAAQYNLGLNALALGDNAEALRWLTLARDQQSNAMIWSAWDFVAASWAIKEASRESGGLPYPMVPLLKSLLLLMPAMLAIQGVSLLLKSVAALRREGS